MLRAVSSAVPTALVCDDEPAGRRAVEAILRRCGFAVITTALSATEGLKSATASPVDVVVVDLALTGERGLGMIQAFRQAQPDCAVVVLSPFESLRTPAMAAGAYAFVATWRSDPQSLERCLGEAADRLVGGRPVGAPFTEYSARPLDPG